MEDFAVEGLLREAAAKLDGAGIDTPRLDAEVLLAHVLNCRRLSLYVEPRRILSSEQLSRFEELISRRLERVPVSYLTGAKEFMGLNFPVTPATLIPRPDTEILTQGVIELLRLRKGELGIADLGTGSGAIIISVLKFVKSARAVAVDISLDALEVAEFNARKFNVDDRVEFRAGDLFAPLEGLKFDAIISNPPYIPAADISTLQAEVQREPRLALDGGEDGLDFYRRIFDRAADFLNDGGFVAVEVGANQAVAVKEISSAAKFHGAEVWRDLADIERVVVAWRD